MAISNNPNDIINRIRSGNWNDSDLESLRQLLKNNDNETLQQLGKFNVSIDDGKKIHIGDRNYFNWSDEAIQAVVEVVQQGKDVTVINSTGKVSIYNYYNYYREETTTIPDETTEETDNLPCPYRGLFTFGPKDAEYFFGREVFIEELYQATQTKRFIPVLGASGSGKSSVIFAGLVPKLQQEDNWQFTHFRPGTDPFYALAQALVPLYTPDLNPTQLIIQADELSNYLKDTKKTNQLLKVFEQIQHNHPQSRTLLIADQFEELYTLCSDEQTRRNFLDILLNTFQSFKEQSSLSTLLIATMRADFLGNVLSYRPLADVLRNGDVKIRSMNEKELREIIEKPAQNLGVNFEAGLVERIFKDIDKEPGNLPLLEFALTELWKKRQGKNLTHKAYKEIGQVSGALTRYADEKYRQLKPEEQQKVHHIFVQLVRPGEGTEDTRRVATKAELNENNWNLVKKLADARLVITNRRVVTREQEDNSEQQQKTEQETVEVVHEALIRNWSQLREWMEADREFRAWQERMRGIMVHWQEMQRDGEQLLRGAALVQAEEKLKERQEELSEAEQEFIRLSQEQQEKEYKQKQRQRQLTFSGLVAFSVIVSLLAIRTFIGEQNALMRAEFGNLKARFAATQDFNALIEGIKLGKNLTKANWAEIKTRIQGIDMLREMVYWQGFKEYNSLDRHTTEINSVAFNHDGKLIASASSDTTATVWREDGTVVTTLRGHTNKIYRVRFGYHLAYGDEELIATASKDTTVKIWTLGGNLVDTLEHNSPAYRVAFSRKGDLIVTATKDGTVKFWKFDGSSFQIFKEHKRHSKEVRKISFSRNGELIGTASYDGTVNLWKSDGSFFKTLTGHQGHKVYSVAFSPNGDLIATASADKTVKLWTSDGNLLNTLEKHKKDVFSVVFNPDGKLIASTSYDNNVILWNRDGHLVNILEGHSDKVFSVDFSHDGKLIASAAADNTIKLWKPNGNLVDTLEGHSNPIYNAVFSPNGSLIASVGKDKTVKLWKKNTVKDTFKRYHCRRIAFSPKGDLIALACYDRKLYILDYHALLKSNDTRIASGISSKGLNSVAFSPKGDYIVTGNASGIIEVWKSDGSLLNNWKGHDKNIYDIAFSPDGNLIATASRDRTIKLWKPDGSEVKTLSDNSHKVLSVIFSPTKDLIISGSYDAKLKFWRQNGIPLKTLEKHEDRIYSIAFSPKGDLMATASADQSVKLWKPNGRFLRSLEGHSNLVTGVAFNPKGNMIASTSHDKTIKLWKRDGTLIHTLLGHNHLVEFLAFSPNDDILLTVSDDKTLKLWNLNLDDLLVRSCNWVSDYLKNNPNVSEEDRRLCGIEPSATAFFLQGEKLAADGNIDEAVSAFQKAVKLDSNLSLNSAKSLVFIGKTLVTQGQVDEAILAYNQAQELDSDLEISADDWNYICWKGSLNNQEEKVMFSCEKAVKIAPDNGLIRNNTGFARALISDFNGAIE
ncbi:MAG: hypothetical protein F6K22_21960 [Okeania sp. SIO2F4]|uniref:nSTAND1 domain-containing NTPase n=1 Tax=Okeania sp. SIO2F4 TaxID=2607790 RepID=UPI00142A7AE3|nr:WD40 repeat domain-containing protein [Okeania sp. SIO2F4]NES05250.1 hypothetical protein [Okeania sp. SIO2F4]